MKKRVVDIVVLSDIHLGTFGSHAVELLLYLRSIEPKILILNGDIVDIWQFRKRYFPKTHLNVLKTCLKIAAAGTPTYYLPGNHDDLLRKFGNISIGNFHLINELTLDLDGKKTWIFHGDKYDKTVKTQWLASFGGICYEYFIVFERGVNKILRSCGLPMLAFAKQLKAFSKKIAKKIHNFEDVAIEEAIKNGYDFVVCGHIHKPQKRLIANEHGSTTYLNSGDWVENLTALEYHRQEWRIARFNPLDYPEAEHQFVEPDTQAEKKNSIDTFHSVLNFF